MTKPQRVQRLLERLEQLEHEMNSVHREVRELHQEMGHPSKEQIQQAALDGKEIMRGCTQP